MNTPLKDAVEAYAATGRARFHMPGHKGLDDPMDVTEVAGCDSLFEASGPILQLENEIAGLYEAGASLLSAGGATLCIQAMLASLGAGATVIAGRGLHRAALNAMVLLDQTPVWVYPQDAGWFRGAYAPEAVARALRETPDAAGVYLTTPDYYGCESDLAAIAAICDEAKKPLLVDNAHGAHLCFFGRHPMQVGASMCADSLHKTLPAMTGGAVLHLRDGEKREQMRRNMALFGSTSPSYPIMLSCERAVVWAQREGQETFLWTQAQFLQLQNVARECGFLLPPWKTDPAKLTFAYGHRGVSDAVFGTWLRESGIEPEYVGGGVCVLMGNGWNRPQEYERVEKTLRGMRWPEGKEVPAPRLPKALKRVMGLREASFSTAVEVNVENAVGRIAARESSPCPPGIPVVMCGEMIDAEMANYLRACGRLRVRITTPQ